ncbi:Right handed beta helix region [Rhodoblastus acidophilus]|uniref:Right handed beta helix region n=1 Tax=Rhodoblastus acidophilus TaxID=1074 RepID=A0A212S9B6_RHOAC|nr:right-handed parallel beta-helix repeat-containing protein [Rhodoblastus acidophilus]PPQ36849.1 right-handed parallel beta-helix repeat-containing protein [Rhodoblastus acidophilus]RAI21435.1 right-handed parallel beta-helix repeat-containing protein [Rhodoblastus acidophilus]SNB81798.1 Right handed beta helix region [Rhodoblastus acidophilus]
MIGLLIGAVLQVAEAQAAALERAMAFPNASTTGVPAGLSLKPSGPLLIDEAGAMVEGLDIDGGVVIAAPNVTLNNCRVRSGGYQVILVKAPGATISHCDIDNLGAGGQGISGAGRFIANNIHGCADGINVSGDNTLIRDNYIHDMKGTADSHFDSIQVDGKLSNLRIEHNAVFNEIGQTSALMLDNYWGPIDHARIERNLFVGGGYTVYINEVAKGQPGGGRVTDVVFVDNLLTAGAYGFWDIRTELGDRPVLSGNRDRVSGRLIPGQSAPEAVRSAKPRPASE